MSKTFKCSGERIPMVQLSLEKKSCARGNGAALNTPEAFAAFVTEHYGCSPQEVVLSVCLDPRNQVLAVHELGKGGLNHTLVDPKVLFAGAIACGASSVVLIHNHPSGDPEPSQMDIVLTDQIKKGGELLTIRLLDHIVVARGGQFVSFAQRGFMGRDFRGYDNLNPEPPAEAGEGSPFTCLE